ncbi:protein Mdm4 isoform X2 [Lissotriton helveticus]
MSTSTSLQPPAPESESCRILPTVQGNRVRPKLPLLRILQEAGAREPSFTLKESSAGTDSDNRAEGGGDSLQMKRKSPYEDYLAEDPLQPLSKQPKMELVFEEWDVAGLPWWFLGNLRNSYDPLSNGSTDIPTNQDIDTAVVSDTTDDLWFLNEAGAEQSNLEVKLETRDHGIDEDDIGEEEKGTGKELLDVSLEEEDLEDSQCLSDDTDTEVTSEGCWQCTKCKKFNSPIKRYCFRCWALRKNWYLDCPKLAHSLSTSDITAKLGEKENDEGIDIPDCRRTISAPVVRPRDQQPLQDRPRLVCVESESLDLARPVYASLGTSRSHKNMLTLSQKSEEQQKEEELALLESTKSILEPCLLCQRKPRNGNIIHGRTAHLVACFLCAKTLQRGGQPCPVCQKQIQMVVKTFIA